MEDELAAADGVVDPLVALNVPLDQFDVPVDLEQVLPMPGGEVVQHAHLVAVTQQPVHEMGPDEPAAPGDQHLFPARHRRDPSEVAATGPFVTLRPW